MTVANTRREVLAALAATAAAVGIAPALSTGAAANPQTGTSAPGFTATDSKGMQHTLAAYKGKTVVLEWTNHECPYTVKHYATGNMQALQKSATDSGAIWLTVVSSRPGTQGHVHALEADKLTDDRKARPTAVLLDPKGDLGRLYEARTTPHMYVIDPAGMLVYMGAIDDQPTANHASVKVARNYVREALDALATRRPIAMASTRPYGCTVKY
jgi:peroxiredoxin